MLNRGGFVFQIDLAALREQPGRPLQWNLTGVVASLCKPGEDQDPVVADPVRVSVKGTYLDGVYWLEGSVEGEALLQCSRCLDQFCYPFVAAFKDKYCESGHCATDEEPIKSGDCMDLDETVRETVLLALPMRPLCREDCQGLCPHCGKALNDGPCGCRPDDFDPRWSKMAALRESGEKGVR